MLKCVGKLMVFILLLGISSCCSLDHEKQLVGLSQQEREYITRFKDEQLVQAANENLRVRWVNVTTAEDIVEISGITVEPVVYSRLLSTADMEPLERRKFFIAQMLPHILIVKHYLNKEKEILEWVLEHEQLRKQHAPERHIFVKNLLAKHKVKTSNELLEKLTHPPTSMILAQAAIDSEWGRSACYSKAGKPFKESEGVGPGSQLQGYGSGGKRLFFKECSSPTEAIVEYFQAVNTQERYKFFRGKLKQTSDPLVLASFIGGKPEGSHHSYGTLLTKVIQENDLRRFDRYVIDPQFLQKPNMDEVHAIIEKQFNRRQERAEQHRDEYARFGVIGLDLQRITPESSSDISTIKGEYVVPYIYDDIVSFDDLPIVAKKRKFFDMMLPALLIAAHEVEEARLKLQILAARLEKGEELTRNDQEYLTGLLQEWQAADIDELLTSKMIVQPSSIMLAQAALETGWGTSRFFTQAKNTFGIWSFNRAEPRMRAKETRGGRIVHVKKYDDLIESIIDYYKLIANGPYSQYRQAIVEKNNPYEMIPYLTRYSELREEYVKRLRVVMNQSKLERFDTYKLDPAFML